ncbi:MAG TPA: hypothetical protein VFM00_05105 [Candidatus Eisenbacteria bacterium]|nr:hypothetical protein [Candidatus Eisenbacteria bacterium]
MNGSTIRTRHPQGKSGKNIAKEKYEAVKTAMLSALRGRELTHPELMQALESNLKGNFDGNVHWYGETVKLDLESRKIVERTATKPQKYRLR